MLAGREGGVVVAGAVFGEADGEEGGGDEADEAEAEEEDGGDVEGDRGGGRRQDGAGEDQEGREDGDLLGGHLSLQGTVRRCERSTGSGGRQAARGRRRRGGDRGVRAAVRAAGGRAGRGL